MDSRHSQNGQVFPDKVILQILPHITLPCALSMRLTSSKWNLLVCSFVRRSRNFVVNFPNGKEESMTAFLRLLQSRIQRDIPFLSYVFYLRDCKVVKTFLNVLGTYITTCKVDVSNTTEMSLSKFAPTLPNVVNLTLIGVRIEFVNYLPHGRALFSKLRVLTVKHLDGAPNIKFNVIENWSLSLTALTSLHVTYPVTLGSQQQLQKFLLTCTNLTNIKSLALNLYFTDETLCNEQKYFGEDLCLDLKVANTSSKFLSNLTANLHNNLVDLSLSLASASSDMDLPVMPKLEALTVTICDFYRFDIFLDLNQAGVFGALKSVYLDLSDLFLNELGYYFKFNSFQTVENLRVKGGFMQDGTPAKPFHLIFPNIGTFKLESVIREGHLKYFCKYLNKITKLEIHCLPDSDLHECLFERWDWETVNENGPPPKGPTISWNLVAMSRLKELTIYEALNLNEIVIGIAILSAQKAMTRLDNICFQGSIGYEWRLLQNCKFHRRVEFIDS